MAISTGDGGGAVFFETSAGGGLTEMRLEFNRMILDAISDKILGGGGVFAWDTGVTQSLLGICLAVAFFQSILKGDEKALLVEWVKIVLAAWFAFAILGGVDYRNVPALSSLDNVPEQYRSKSSKPSLERAIFNNLSYRFDAIGHALKANLGGKTIGTATQNLAAIQGRMALSMLYCNVKDKDCIVQYVNGDLKTPTQKAAESGGFTVNIAAYLEEKFTSWFALLTNPAAILFPLINWILEVVRGFVNQFVLLTFGLTAAISLLLLKVLSVFVVIPNYRKKVLDMWKDTMAITLFGFVMNLIIWLSVIVTEAISNATTLMIIQKIESLSLSAMGDIYMILISNYLTAFVLLFMQIVAFTKIPSICKSIMNLSLNEIVNIGEMLVTSALGAAKFAAQIGLVATGAGAGLLAGKMAGTAGAQALGSKMGSIGAGIRDKVRGYSDLGGGGSPGGDGVGGPPPGRSASGNSLEKTALADTNMKVSTQGKSSVLKKEGSEEQGKSDSQDNVASKENRPKTEREKKVEAWESKKAALSKLNNLRKANGLTLGNVNNAMWEAMGSGAKGYSGGDVSTLGKVGGAVAGTLGDSSLVGKAYDAGKGEEDVKLTAAERSAKSEEVFLQAARGKQENTEAEDLEFEQNIQAINSGKANEETMLKVLQSSNTRKLSEDQKGQIASARKTNKSFNQFSTDEESRNNKLMQKIENEVLTSGTLSDKSLSELSGLSASGMIDIDQVANTRVTPNGLSNETADRQSLAKVMQSTSQREMDSVIKTLNDKLGKGQGLNQTELNTASELFNVQKSSLVGDRSRIESFDKILNNKEESKYLMGEDLGTLVKGLSSQTGRITTVSDKLKMVNKVIEEAGVNRVSEEIDGVFIGGKKVSSADDYSNLQKSEQKIIDDMLKQMEMLDSASPENELISKIDKNLLESDKFNNMKNFLNNLKKG